MLNLLCTVQYTRTYTVLEYNFNISSAIGLSPEAKITVIVAPFHSLYCCEIPPFSTSNTYKVYKNWEDQILNLVRKM